MAEWAKIDAPVHAENDRYGTTLRKALTLVRYITS
jgi:hypothetical protein